MCRMKIKKRCLGFAFYLSTSLPFYLSTCLYAGSSLHYVNHWHDHQPIYWPNQSRAGIARWELAPESIDNKNNSPWPGHPNNDLSAIFGLADRVAAYQYRCRDALGTIGTYPEAGFTVSYTGALAENVGALGAQFRLGYSPSWKDPWREARGWMTSGGKTRMDIVLTGFHHNFFPLLPDDTLARRYIQTYKAIYSEHWGNHVPMSTGFWPLEGAFSIRMIPYLLQEGITWTYVANSHISRAYPEWSTVATPGNGMNTEPPNRADQRNSFPGGYTPQWRKANIDGRPTTNELRYSYRPRYTQYVDPNDGTIHKIIAVPFADYESYVDGYQTFPVDLFDAPAAAAEPGKPPLVVLAHDGDNAWGGGFDSYMTNTPNKASGASARGYTPSQVSQYLSDHPVDINDVIHVEDGPWVNAAGDFGSPTFSNWNWPWINPRGLNEHPIFDATAWDDNSQFWAITTALTNRVLTAEQRFGSAPNIYRIVRPETGGNNLEYAWHYLLGFGDSGHIYYGTSSDFTFIPVVGGNRAADYADAVLGHTGELPSGFSETVPPTIWVPQRFPYNPGALNFGCAYKWKSWNYPTNFHVFTFAYDASGLSSVKLKYRTATGTNKTPVHPDNFTYAGGTAVGTWQEIVMSSGTWPVKLFINGTEQIPTPVQPKYLPLRYWAEINVGPNKLVDYYVEATDKKGNVRRSPIQHVWVGDGAGAGGGGTQLWTPTNPTADQQVTIYASQVKPGKLHWGVNNWTQPSSEYWPANSTTTIHSVQAVQTRLLWNGTSYYITLGPFLGSQSVSEINFVFQWDDGTWDNNGGANWKITVSPADNTPPPAPTRLTPTAKNQRIDLLWEPVTGVSLAGYNIYEWSVSNSTYVRLASLITWTTGYAVTISTPSNTALVNGTTYQYSVTSVKSTGTNPESSFSAPITTSPVAIDNRPPQTPINFYATGGVTSTIVYWTKNLETDLANYKLYVSTYSCGFLLKTATATPTTVQTSYQSTGLTAGVTYYYQLTAIDGLSNESPPTTEVSALAQSVSPPSAPTGLTATAGNQKVDLKWNPNTESNLAGYNLYCSSVGVYFKVNQSLISGATTYSNTSLTNGVTYYYKLTAVNTLGGESNYSSEVSARPMDLVEVIFQVDMRGLGNVTSVAIAQNTLQPLWNTTHYAMTQQTGNLLGVWRITLNLSAGVQLQYKYVMNGGTWENDFGTAPNNNRLITINPNNGPKMYVSNKWNVAGDAIPAIPTGLSAQGNIGGVLLGWNANTEFDLERYNIYNSTWAANPNYTYIVSATSTSYQIGGLLTGTTYHFKIEAEDLARQKSGLTGSVNAVAGQDPPPAAPTGVAATASSGTISVSWNANTEPDLAGYFVRWGTVNTGPYPNSSPLISKTTTVYTITNLTNGTTYYIVVRASDTAGGISSPSSQVSAMPQVLPEFEERVIDGNFLDWKASDVRVLDPCEDAYVFNDGYDSSRDLVAFYSREGRDNYYFRVDIHELGLFAENSHLNIYLAIDCASGGQTWLPDFADTQTDTPWEVCVAIDNATVWNVFRHDWSTSNTAFKGVRFNSALDSVEFALDKALLKSYGWTDGQELRFQIYTTKDGTNGGLGEIPGSDVVDAAGATIDRGGGFLRGNVLSNASTGRAKYAFIYHANQSINQAKDIRDWVERNEPPGSATNKTGFVRGLDTIENYGVKGNLHISGSLTSALQWAQPSFINRVKAMESAGKVKIIGGVLAEHIMPYFENNASAGLFVNSESIRQRDNLLKNVFGLSQTPKVFWTPERVIRGQTFQDILYYDANVSSPTGYTATILDDKYHIMDWFYSSNLGLLGQNKFKLHKINNVLTFLINGVRVGAELPPSDASVQSTYGYYDPDGAKFWNQDSGLHIGTRKLLIERAMDSDQQKLVLVFDDWEAYAGRSFTDATANPNPDNWDKTVRWIANKQWIETVTLEDVLSRNWTPVDHGTNINLPIKTYCWLNRATQGSYDNWYWGSSLEESFANRKPFVRAGVTIPSNRTYGHINTAGTILRDAWDAVRNAPGGQMKEYASMVYNTLTYETAWHDQQGSKWDGPDTTWNPISGWALYLHGHIRYATIISSAARWAQEVAGGQWSAVSVQSADIDLDGEPEYILKNNKVFAVFERIGGRLVAAFAYDPAVGALQLIGATATNREHEGEEVATKQTSAFREMNGGVYENALYNVSVWSSSITFISPDNHIRKTIALYSDTLTANYSETVTGAVYIRFGIVPNAYDMYFNGKTNVVAISSAPVFGFRNLSGGLVTLNIGGTTLNTAFTDGTSDNTNNPHCYGMEIYGDGTFSFSLRLSNTGAVDTTPPGAITNLVASTGANDGEINLTWTAPGDDGYTGNNEPTAKYHVRYATFSPTGNVELWWQSATVFNQNWPVSPQGTTENRIVTGLAKGTRYYIAIKTQDESNNISGIQIVASAETRPDTVPPNTITTLFASTGTIDGSIILSWLAPGDDGNVGTAKEYDIRLSSIASDSPAINLTKFSQAQLVSTLSPIPYPLPSGSFQAMTVTGLIPGNTYYFAMRAKDASIWSDLSNGATSIARIDNIPPSDITNLVATTGLSAGNINLSWTAPGNDGTIGTASAYTIKISSTANITNNTQFDAALPLSALSPTQIQIPATAGMTESLIVTGLVPGATYYFAIRARDQANNINNWVSDLTKNTTNFARAGLSAVTDFRASTQTTISIRWDWSDITGETGYQIVADTFTYNASPVLAANTTFYVESGLSPNQKLIRRVKAFFDGLTSLSNSATSWTLSNPPTGSNIVSVSVSSISISWSANNNPDYTQYQIERSTTGSVFLPLYLSTSLTYSDISITEGSTYFYRVRSLNGNNIASSFDTTVSTTVPRIPPAAITNLSALTGATQGSVNLSWTAPKEDGATGGAVTSYIVKYASFPVDDTNWSQATTASNPPAPLTPGFTQTMTIMNLTAGATYYFRIKSVDDAWNISPISNSASSIAAGVGAQLPKPPIYIAFLWHMHQPIYYPYENVVQTNDANRYSFSVINVHTSRTGPYTSWPKGAVEKGLGLRKLGAQVSFSGSLMENINNIVAANRGFWSGWQNDYITARNWLTQAEPSIPPGAVSAGGGNPRMDMVAFGHHHPLMGLIDYNDIRRQIQLHRLRFGQVFGTTPPYSKGIFPPENAFRPEMIPALVDEGIQWVLVDNVHFDRTVKGYPWNSGGNLYEPNPADQLNNPAGITWLQLTNLWAPTRVSVPWGYRPHYVAYRDPTTGETKKIIAVPGARYEGNEDARGGFGALQYEAVMSQYEQYNTDARRPMLVVLPHDGDNYGGGTESYYGSNFQNFVNWLLANPHRFVCTTIQDYLDMFPPDPVNDVIHVENGSWSGADNGDPEFLKWNAPPDATGYSHDRNSWAVMIAAKNRLDTAEKNLPAASLSDILNNTGNNTAKAWHYYYCGQQSCYWYWDGTEIWDSNPTRAANQAVHYADLVLGANPADTVGPSIYYPQRDPYNPGGNEWGKLQTSTFTVWTLVYDVSGLSSVQLKYRIDPDGVRDSSNGLYSGGTWNSISMTSRDWASRTNPAPTYKASEYSARVTGVSNALVDYYVEATDTKGNISKSPILHVWVGQATTPSPTTLWTPTNPTTNDVITIRASVDNKPGKLHWGVNNWIQPNSVYWPGNSTTTIWGTDGKAVQTVLLSTETGKYFIQLGPFNKSQQQVSQINFVFNWNDGTWDNNSNQNWNINLSVVAATPTVSITYPAQNFSVTTSSVDISATATDDVGVTKVEFFYRSTATVTWTFISSHTVSPYVTSWNVTGLNEDSDYILQARAYDADNNVGISPDVKVRINLINQPPSVTILEPVGGELWTGSRNIRWTATDPDGDTLGITLQYIRSDITWTNIATNLLNIGTHTWNTTFLPNSTSYMVRVIASDNGGLTGISISGQFTLRNYPGTITDLTASSALDGQGIELSWTAPGADWTVATCSAYDIKYSTSISASPAISIDNFNSARSVSQFSPIPPPSPPGSGQTLLLTGLLSNATYYFAIRSRDEVPLWSEISNGATAYTLPDIIAPAAVANLSATVLSANSVRLTWTSPGDDGNSGTLLSGSKFVVKYSTNSADGWSSVNVVTISTSNVSPGSSQIRIIENLLNGTSHYFWIRTYDEVGNESELSNGATAYTPAGVTFRNITVDGSLADWLPAENMGLRNGNTFYFTWSSTAIYICYAGPDVNTTNNDFFVLFDTHTDYNTTVGTTSPVTAWDGAENHILPFRADYALCVEGTGYRAVRNWTGSLWNDPGNGGGIASVSLGATVNEIAILRSTLNNPTKLRVLMFHKWETARNVYNAYPTQNPAPNDASNVTFTHFYDVNLVSGVNPKDSPVLSTTTANTDNIPPSAINNLSASPGPSAGQISINWTATGDDGTSGNVSNGYWRIAFSTNPAFNFQLANYNIQISTSYSPSSGHSYTISELIWGATYYIRLWAADENNNWSAISNGATNYVATGSPTPVMDGTKDAAWGTTPVGTSPNSRQPGDFSRGIFVTYDANYLYIGFWFGGDPWDESPTARSAHYNFFIDTNTTSGGSSDPWQSNTGINWTNRPDIAVCGWVNGTGATSFGGMTRYVWTGSAWGTGTSMTSGTDFGSNKNNNWAEFRLPRTSLGLTAGKTLQILGIFRPADNKPGVSDSTPYDSACSDWADVGATLTQFFTYTIPSDDSTPPAAVIDLSAQPGADAGTVQLQWTATGDDGNTGNIVNGQFEIRYSTSFDFSTFLPLYLSTSSASGSIQNYTVAGLVPASTYYFRLRLADEVPNWSGLSNTATTYATPQPSPCGPFTPVIDGTKDSFWGSVPNTISVGFKSPDNRARDLYITNDAQFLYLGFQFNGDPWNDGLSAHYNFFFDTVTVSGTTTDPWMSNTTINWNHKPDIAVNGWINGPTATSLGGMLRFRSDGINWGPGASMVSGTDFASNKTNDWAEFRIPLSVLGITTGQNVHIVHIFRPAENKPGITDSTPYDASACNDWGNSNSVVTASYTYTLRSLGDITAPAAVTSLSAQAGTTEGQITLSWISPGDDNWSGTLVSGSMFKVQYSTYTEVVWSTSNAQVIISTSGVSPLFAIRYSLFAMSPGATYFFRLWTRDEAFNWSGISNAATTWAQVDVTPPAVITDLTAAVGVNSGEINLQWTSPGDDGTVGNIVNGSFEIRYSTSSDLSTFLSIYLSTSSTSGSIQNYTITGLEPARTYFFRLRTADERSNWSVFSNTASAYAQFDNVPPAMVSDLFAEPGFGERNVRLRWTSPGDDGNVGNIVNGQFEIRHSTSSDLSTFLSIYLSTSTTSGSIQSYTVTGLLGGSTYYFRIRTADEETPPFKQRNWSELSNTTSTITNFVVITATKSIFEVTSSSRPGGVITYRIMVTNNGNIAQSNVVIRDKIPQNCNYVAETIHLGGVLKTDALDGDEAEFDISNNLVKVNIPTIGVAESVVIEFKAQIK